MKRFLLSLLTLWLAILPAQAGFFGPSNFGSGFFTPGEVTASVTVNIDPPIDTATASKVQLAFGFDQLVESFSGDTVRLVRVSDSAESDFGFDATGRFDTSAVCTWAAGSAVKLKQFYDQVGTGEVHSYGTQPTFMDASCGVTRFGTTWSSTDGQLSRSNQGGVGVLYDGATISGSTTTSGITTASGLEVHILASPNTRKVGSGITDPAGLSPDGNRAVFWEYYVAANRYLQNRLSDGGYLDIGRFYTSGDGGTNITLNNNTTNGATGTIDNSALKKYQTHVDTIAISGTVVKRYRYGAKTMERAMNAATQTAFGNLTNGTLYTGVGGPGFAYYADYLFGGIIVTDTLTDYERYMVQAKLTALAQQHLLIDVATLTGYFDEFVDFRDANAGTGQVAGRNGLLTIQYDTTGSPTTDYSYTSVLGVKGVRNPDNANNDNTFAATDNYFYDAQQATILTFTVPEQSGIFDIWSMNPTTDANGYASGTNGLSIGVDHAQPRLIVDVDDTLDTNGYAGSYGYTDNCTFSQGNMKYGEKLVIGDWQPPVVTSADCTLGAPWSSRFIASGSTITQSDVESWTNLFAPTPELDNDYQIDFETKGANVPQLYIATLQPNANYDFAGTQSAREPYMKRATNYLYAAAGTGAPISHIDSSVGSEIDSGNHMHLTSSYKILSGKYQGTTMEGTNLLWGFKKGVLTQTQAMQVNVSLYKIYNDGYPITDLDDAPGVQGHYTASAANVTDDGGGVISQWNDTSGNAKHLTASTTARPTLSEGTGPNGTDEIVFNGTSNVMNNNSFPDTSDVATVCWASDYETGDNSQGVFSLADTLGGGLNRGIQQILDSGTTTYTRVYEATTNPASVTQSVTLPVASDVHCLVYDGVTTNTLKYYRGGVQVGSTAVAGSLSNTISRLYVGGAGIAAGGYLLKGGMRELFVAYHIYTPSQLQDIVDLMSEPLGLSALPTVNVLIAGDSMAEPALFGDNTWGERIAQMLPSTGTVENVADSGDTVDDQITLSNAASTTPTAAAVDAAAILAGHNNIFTSIDDAATVFALLMDWVADRVADGFDYIYVVALPQSGGTDSGSDAVVKGVNDLLRADTSGDFTLIDLSGVGGLFDDSDDAACDVPECHTDRIHPDDTGHRAIAGEIMTDLNPHIYNGSMLTNNVIDLMQFARRKGLQKLPEVA